MLGGINGMGSRCSWASSRESGKPEAELPCRQAHHFQELPSEPAD